MEKLEDIKEIYKNTVTATREKLSKTQKQIFHIGTIRLLLFIAGIAGIIYFWSGSWPVIGIIVLLTFVPFLILVKKHNRLFYKKEYLEKKIEINEQELMAMDCNFSSFDGGQLIN